MPIIAGSKLLTNIIINKYPPKNKRNQRNATTYRKSSINGIGMADIEAKIPKIMQSSIAYFPLYPPAICKEYPPIYRI